MSKQPALPFATKPRAAAAGTSATNAIAPLGDTEIADEPVEEVADGGFTGGHGVGTRTLPGSRTIRASVRGRESNGCMVKSSFLGTPQATKVLPWRPHISVFPLNFMWVQGLVEP